MVYCANRVTIPSAEYICYKDVKQKNIKSHIINIKCDTYKSNCTDHYKIGRSNSSLAGWFLAWVINVFKSKYMPNVLFLNGVTMLNLNSTDTCSRSNYYVPLAIMSQGKIPNGSFLRQGGYYNNKLCNHII